MPSNGKSLLDNGFDCVIFVLTTNIIVWKEIPLRPLYQRGGLGKRLPWKQVIARCAIRSTMKFRYCGRGFQPRRVNLAKAATAESRLESRSHGVLKNVFIGKASPTTGQADTHRRLTKEERFHAQTARFGSSTNIRDCAYGPPSGGVCHNTRTHPLRSRGRQ